MADMSTDRLFQYIMRDDYPDWSMEQFLGQCLLTKDGEDWSAQLAREPGVSSVSDENGKGVRALFAECERRSRSRVVMLIPSRVTYSHFGTLICLNRSAFRFRNID